MQPKGLLPCSQEPATGPYAVYNFPLYVTSIIILYFHLRLGLPSDLFPSGFPTKILNAFYVSPCVLHVPPISYS
jgi:hypothetical protein